MVYQQITGDRVPTLADAGGSGVERITYQITSWATTYLSANAVAEQVRLAMNAATSFTVTSSPERRDYFEDDTRLYAVEYDFFIHY